MSTQGPHLTGLYGLEQKRPLYSKYPSLYFLTPSWVRSLSRRILVGKKGEPAVLIKSYLERLKVFGDAGGMRVPILLTHDVDTARGLKTLPRLLKAEEAQGFRSLTLLVTHRYRWKSGDLLAHHQAGHRFGVHDTTHDNTIAYIAPDQVRARIDQARAALGELGSSAFRAPAFLRSSELYEGLQGRVAFDFSSNDWALAWPHPGDGTAYPFPVRHKGLVCAPTNMPRDGEMLALGLSWSQMRDLCVQKARQLARVGAPVIFLNHPDPGFTDSDEAIDTYGALLKWFKECGLFQILAPDACLKELDRLATVRI